MAKRKGIMKAMFQAAAAGFVAMPLMFSAAAIAQDATGPDIVEEPAVAMQADDGAQSSTSVENNDISYIYPWVLGGMAGLPLLWWLLRSTPPRPQRYDFPAIRILDSVEPTEDTPAKTPPWQLLMRMSIGAAVIMAMSQPLLNENEPLAGEGPLLMVVENGWASAPNWEARQDEMQTRINSAEREGRQIIIVPAANKDNNGVVRSSGLLTAEQAREYVEGLEPQPWLIDRSAVNDALADIEGPVSTVWLSNGLDMEGTTELAQRLEALGHLVVLEDKDSDRPMILLPPEVQNGPLSVTVRRAVAAEQPEIESVIARAADGRVIERAQVTFEPGQTEAQAIFRLPTEIRNELTQLSIEGENSAGAIILLDERWRQRPVGIVESSAPEPGDPLLDESYYVERALEPYADLHEGNIQTLLEEEMSVIVLTDTARLSNEELLQLDDWIRNGGTVLRFAGENMAEDADSLLPVRIRQGDRNLGGAMSWGEPARLAPFAPSSPFFGLELPENITVERQVLAISGALGERVWAKLEDGTPLVTAEKRGKGTLVLVHTTSDPSWSNLAISGLFVDMLQKVVEQSQGVVVGLDDETALQPWRTLDAEGNLVEPPVEARGLTADIANGHILGPQTPPGFYGPESGRKAHNLSEAIDAFTQVSELPEDAVRAVYSGDRQMELTGPLLTGALGLLVLDLLVVMGQRGMLPGSGAANTRRRTNDNNNRRAAAPNL